MIKAKNLVLLRQYGFEKGSDEISINLLKEVFQQAINEGKMEVTIADEEISTGGLFGNTYKSFAILNKENAKYLPVYVFSYVDKKIPLIEIVTMGKGEQINDAELGSMLAKKQSNIKNFFRDAVDAYSRGKAVGKKIGGSGLAGGVGGLIGLGIGSLVGGSINLIAKGIKSVMRDKEAYEKELIYYDTILTLSDSIILGN